MIKKQKAKPRIILNKAFVKKQLVFFLAILVLFQVNAQESSLDKTSSKSKEAFDGSRHSINLELGGRTLIIGSLNYEFSVRRQFSLGVGLGLNSVARGGIIRNNGGVTEEGTFFDLYSAHMFYGNYFIGKNKHRLLLTMGISNFKSFSKTKYPSETLVKRDKDFQWNLGVGYEFTGERMYFRATAYFLALPNISIYAPDYLPWIGLTMGHKL